MKIMFRLYIFGIISAVLCSTDFPSVKLESGTINGVYLKSFKGKQFNAFLGIPFAKPPINELRFQNPEPAYPITGVFEANKDSVVCIQRNDFFRDPTIYGQEDCLYLNVYTPKNPKSEKLPVFVFIHGGGWLAGAGTRAVIGPEFLMDSEDIILVVPNYRLGPFGFLSTEDEFSPGNYGLKDQQLALKWVQKYIKYFGGDRNSVTLGGQSAGAASTNYHFFSKGSRGLFHRAILQSGCAFAQWAHYYKGDARGVAEDYAKALNCPTDNSQVIVNCLRNKDAIDLVDKLHFVYTFDYNPVIPFRPVKEYKSKTAFMTRDPTVLYEDGEVPDIPIMMGITADEGAIMTAGLMPQQNLVDEMFENFEKVFPMIFLYNRTAVDKNSISKAILNNCFENKKIDKYQKQQFTDCVSYALVNLGVDFAARLHLHYQKQKLYFYNFMYKGTLTIAPFYGGSPDEDYGVVHSDDLLYLFKHDSKLWNGKKMSEKDIEMVDTMTSIWINFIKTSTPLEKEIWKPATLPHIPYLEINGPTDLKMSGNDNILQKGLKFWYGIPFNTQIYNKYFELSKLQRDEL